MEAHISTTPFGRRPMSLGMLASQVAAKEIDKNTAVHKWHVFQDVKEARTALGATDRGLAILNALLSFHPDTTLHGDGELIVWPSNEQLIGRANGMPPTTLRRHLAILVECGLIIRRDSPNGKRFARKGLGGAIEQAYGFDLSPIVARAVEFKELAEALRTEKKLFRLTKERVTLCRRDIVKMIDAGIDEGVPANWGRVQQAYQTIVMSIPRTAPRQVLDTALEALQELWAEIRDVLESFVKTRKMDANESQNGCHIQNSNTDSISESRNSSGIKEEAGGKVEEVGNVSTLPVRELPLGIVLDACPDFVMLAKGSTGVRNWREFFAVAETARPSLGVSPSAWEDARTAMGEQQAAITIAGIYQRQQEINSAGGYLRSLTEKAREGKFSVWPMIMALLRAKLDAAKVDGTGKSSGTSVVETAEKVVNIENRLEISDALLRSLRKPEG